MFFNDLEFISGSSLSRLSEPSGAVRTYRGDMTHPSLYPLSLGYSQGWVGIEICLDPPVANPIGPGWLRACFRKTKSKNAKDGR